MNKTAKTQEVRLQEQIAQFKDVEQMHSGLSDLNTYWKKAHHAPRFLKATGTSNHIDFYGRQAKEAATKCGICRIASLGSGDGAVEVQVAKKLESIDIKDYEFDLIELSPHQNERACRAIHSAGLSGKFNVVEADFNEWTTHEHYSTIMAHHSLHHVMELEHLFDQVFTGLLYDGRFLTLDIIGRNGHLRWPETYQIINAFWHFLPPDKRTHAIFGDWDNGDYRDHDCSTQGFEGIRAQDILPELLSRFYFETFFAWGGLTDVFIGRAYGQNFDPKSVEDRKFIGLIDELNEALIDLDVIKPTNLCAAMAKVPVKNSRLFKGRAPENMVRSGS